MPVDYLLSQIRWMISISRILLQHKVNPAKAISSQHLTYILYILASEMFLNFKSFNRNSREDTERSTLTKFIILE